MEADKLITKKYKNKLGLFGRNEVQELMIEFAKIHVKAALKKASENVKLDSYESLKELPNDYEEPFKYIRDELGNITAINRDSILNAYLDELIK